jgi:hypothetical protein
MTNAVVTGRPGFIGGRLVEALGRCGTEVPRSVRAYGHTASARSGS